MMIMDCVVFVFFFQAEDGIRDLVRSRGLGDVYKRQGGGKALPLRRGIAFASSQNWGRRIAASSGLMEQMLSLIHI